MFDYTLMGYQAPTLSAVVVPLQAADDADATGQVIERLAPDHAAGVQFCCVLRGAAVPKGTAQDLAALVRRGGPPELEPVADFMVFGWDAAADDVIAHRLPAPGWQMAAYAVIDAMPRHYRFVGAFAPDVRLLLTWGEIVEAFAPDQVQRERAPRVLESIA